MHPDAHGPYFFVVVPLALAAGVVAVWLIHLLLDLGEGILKFAIELAFLAAIGGLMHVGWSTKSLPAPVAAWVHELPKK